MEINNRVLVITDITQKIGDRNETRDCRDKFSEPDFSNCPFTVTQVKYSEIHEIKW